MGYCPLFDHDHAFAESENILSQTTEQKICLKDAAINAQKILNMNLCALTRMEKPAFLNEKQWKKVLERVNILEHFQA